MQPDFEQLYSLLRLSPDCTLEEFHRAYRRAIAEMHPDRGAADRRGVEQQSQLRDLISLHAQAKIFHRRHGRLPGASNHAPPPKPTAARISKEHATFSPPAAPESHGTTLRWLLVVALVAFASWRLGQDTSISGDALDANTADGLYLVNNGTSPPGYLAVGMDWETVLLIQGEPDHRGATLWQYGASWVRFQDQHVVDWYSSPFQRLRTNTEKPRPR